MKWIDEKGRLWGRINIIDMILILIVIAALAFVGIKFMGKGQIAIIPEKQEVSVTIFTNALFHFVKDQLQVGEEVRLLTNNEVFGQIVDLETRNGFQLVSTADGRWVEADIPNKYSVNITIKGNAVKSGEFLSIGGTQLLVGSEVAIKGSRFTVKGIISDVK